MARRIPPSAGVLEAQAFAYLAVRVLKGLPTSAPMTTGVPAAVGGGRVQLAREADEARQILIDAGLEAELRDA